MRGLNPNMIRKLSLIATGMTFLFGSACRPEGYWVNILNGLTDTAVATATGIIVTNALGG